MREVPKATARLGVEGIAWYRKNVEGVPVLSGDDQYNFFGETGTHEFLRWLGDVFSIKTPELKRNTIVSAMYATFGANATEAKTFWAQVARGGLEFDDSAPSTVLDTWLKTAREDRAQDLKPGSFYQGCIYAWNACREGKSVKDIKHDVRKGFHRVVG